MTQLTGQELDDALALVTFLDTRYGEDIAALPADSPGGRDALAHRLIVDQARVDLTSPRTTDQHLLRWRAVTTLQELSRRWAGNPEGFRRHPDYRAAWLPASYYPDAN
ncbi:hypothetical protein ACIP68_23030 [Streptomyces griseoviridis]